MRFSTSTSAQHERKTREERKVVFFSRTIQKRNKQISRVLGARKQ